jgi:hypothetical protein
VIRQLPKPPAQILFDRVIRTWIAPTAQERVKDPYIGPLPPRLAVVIWPNSGNKPQMHQNAEVHAHVPALDTRSDAAVVRKRQLRAHLRENDDGLTKQLSLECRLFLVT